MPTNDYPMDDQWYAPVQPVFRPDAHELVVLLRSPVDDVAGLVAGLNQRLQDDGSHWQFESEDDGTHPVVTPLTLSYPSMAVADEPKPGPSWLLNLVMRGGVSVWADPMLIGSPAYKPHALTRGDFGRVPVDILAQDPPPRRPRSVLPRGRRPLVALLDTAVQPHRWLGEPDHDLAGDGFWVDARRMGWSPGRRLPEPGAPPAEAGPLGRELGLQEGHGTFCAGLVRQVAPDARVLAVHVIGDDGGVYGDHVLNALGWLLEDDHLVVGDVVCLPFGFQPIWPTDSTYLGWLGAVLGELGQRGILVVAAAGNDGEPYPVYPAAFTAALRQPKTPLVSVGALNSNGKTPAEFSNYGNDLYGHWVTAWEVGTSVVSTFPPVDGAARPELVSEGDGNRESADPDDFTGGFARWSGTSFAATIYAAKLARHRANIAFDAVTPNPA
jgi:hypothetical protein